MPLSEVTSMILTSDNMMLWKKNDWKASRATFFFFLRRAQFVFLFHFMVRFLYQIPLSNLWIQQALWFWPIVYFVMPLQKTQLLQFFKFFYFSSKTWNRKLGPTLSNWYFASLPMLLVAVLPPLGTVSHRMDLAG